VKTESFMLPPFVVDPSPVLIAKGPCMLRVTSLHNFIIGGPDITPMFAANSQGSGYAIFVNQESATLPDTRLGPDDMVYACPYSKEDSYIQLWVMAWTG
jgi:hypothetical protein